MPPQEIQHLWADEPGVAVVHVVAGMVDDVNEAQHLDAVIIAVGSELLTPDKTDTNSLYITQVLNELGIAVAFKSIVGDNRQELQAHVAHALSRHRVLILTGGLGPTDDDVTREAVAGALGLEMAEDDAITARIRQRFARRGLEMPAVNRKQAMVPQGATWIPNPNGSAPGLWLRVGPRLVVLLPGPPRELQPMLIELCAPGGVIGGGAGFEGLHRA